MIFITVKFSVRPEDAEKWPEITADFTAATRAEPGCLWFDWSRSLDDPSEYVESTFRVSERKYAAWPTAIREGFEVARTVKPGKPTFRLFVGEAR